MVVDLVVLLLIGGGVGCDIPLQPLLLYCNTDTETCDAAAADVYWCT